MSVYVIAQIEIEDRERYGVYEAGFLEIFQRHEGRLLAVDENQQAIEGECPWTRTVLLEFPSEEAMRAWYDSCEYQELVEHRWRASKPQITLVRGIG